MSGSKQDLAQREAELRAMFAEREGLHSQALQALEREKAGLESQVTLLRL